MESGILVPSGTAHFFCPSIDVRISLVLAPPPIEVVESLTVTLCLIVSLDSKSPELE